MKNKKLLFIILGVLVVCFVGATFFFVSQGILASNKEQKYVDFYRNEAEEYIKANSEMLNKYGDDFSVDFDNSVTYSLSEERGFFDRYIELFAPKVPDTIEEFTDGIDAIKFGFEIKRDKYEIIFEKNSDGELVVTNLSEKNK